MICHIEQIRKMKNDIPISNTSSYKSRYWYERYTLKFKFIRPNFDKSWKHYIVK